jgi:hypothetical protein
MQTYRTWQGDDLQNFSLTYEALMAAASLRPRMGLLQAADSVVTLSIFSVTDEDLQRTWQGDDLQNFSLTCEALMAAASLGPCVLVIDGVDELCSTCGLTQKEVIIIQATYMDKPFLVTLQCMSLFLSQHSLYSTIY